MKKKEFKTSNHETTYYEEENQKTENCILLILINK